MATHWKSGYDVNASWTGQDWLGAMGRTLRIDPYLVWAEATRFLDVGGMPNDWVPILIEVRDPGTREFAHKIAQRRDNQGDQTWFKLHHWYSDPAATFEGATFCTALVKKAFFQKLLGEEPAGSTDEPLHTLIKRFELGLPIVAQAELESDPPGPQTNLPYENGAVSCVVGVIDDGLAFAHDRFRKPDGTTRVDFFWNQGYYSRDIDEPVYGREYSNADINDYMRHSKVRGVVDEDAVYRLACYREVRRRIAHGTHVLDLACGCDPGDLHAESPRIVGVQLQLPSRKTRDRSAGWLATRVLDGLRYILDCADDLAPHCPVVVNLSFGNIAGPHDGSSMIECAMDQLIRLRRPYAPCEVVIAAGNSNLVRCHAKFSIPYQRSHVLNWRILPDDPTPNFLEIWLPRRGSSNDGCEVTVTTPSGDESISVRAGNVYTWCPRNDTLCTVVYLNEIATGDRDMVLVAIEPTVSFETRDVAPSGTWDVSIKNLNTSGTLDVDAWIQRDDTPFDFPRHGRQSRFEDQNYQRFEGEEKDIPEDSPIRRVRGRVKADDEGNDDSDIKRSGTINSIATGEEPTVVGGFRRSDGAAVPYSSSGPALQSAGGQPPKAVPDLSAASEDSVGCHGILAAGTRSGSVVAINGTSVAAPSVTRRISMQMAAGNWGGRTAFHDQIQGEESTNPPDYKPKPPDSRVGLGRIRTPLVTKVARQERA
ncbi:MAG: S8 family serine peptidase [Burkholderiales bacterium]